MVMHATALPSQTSDMHPGNAYFTYLARCFPVMCASDEFHFLPRATQAAEYYDRLDDLDAHTVSDILTRLKAFQATFARQASASHELEEQIDFVLLQSNAAGAIIELEQNQAWRQNPLFYLKIACIGVDQALNKPAASVQEKAVRIRSRLLGLPRLLQQATVNLNRIPQTYYHASLATIHDARRYLTSIAQAESSVGLNLNIEIEGALNALSDFNRFVTVQVPLPDTDCAAGSLEASLTEHFLTSYTCDDIYRFALDEWHQTLEDLKQLEQQIDPSKSWQELYHAFKPNMSRNMDTLSLYAKEIDKLRSFFSKNGFRPQDLDAPLELAETPLYLHSVRSSASFCAALREGEGEKSYFYMTLPQSVGQKDEEVLLQQRLHREYKYLTAHETIPGHHVLDSFRRRMANPIRQQIESPLFYEGWATYVESLLTEQGYITRPIEVLVDYKRRLWRCARCMIDVGLPTQRLTKADARKLLMEVGFSEAESRKQIARFQLNPGYQICYSLGRNEFMRLRNTYTEGMARERFHTFILEGGQLPFRLIEERLAHATSGTHPV